MELFVTQHSHGNRAVALASRRLPCFQQQLAPTVRYPGIRMANLYPETHLILEKAPWQVLGWGSFVSILEPLKYEENQL